MDQLNIRFHSCNSLPKESFWLISGYYLIHYDETMTSFKDDMNSMTDCLLRAIGCSKSCAEVLDLDLLDS